MFVGEIIKGKWEIVSVVGKGSSATVFLAIDEHLHKQVVIKEYNDVIKNKYQFLVRHEVDILSSLKHSGIPQIYDIIEDSTNLVIIMEYIQGKTIDRIIQENSPFTEKYAINIAKQLVNILRYIHSNNIIYRDLKPSNIMITNTNRVVLVDFGAAMVQSLQKSETVICLGTRGYAAPEQFDKSRQQDFRADVYGFGATLYYMLTGVSPANIHSFSIKKVNVNFSNALEFIILKCTQLNPENRYQNIDQLIQHFKNIKALNKSLKVRHSIKIMTRRNSNNIMKKEDIPNEFHSTYIPPIPKLDETIILSAGIDIKLMPPPIMDIQDVNIFLSYCNFDNDLADIIYDKLNDYSFIHISRYTMNVPYKGSFSEFMNTLRKHDKVIMIISDKYLKSRACMYEVGQLLNSIDLQKKILFVICSNDDKKYYKTKTEENIEAQIYDPHKRNQYIIYWEDQCNLLEKDLNIIKDECAKIETLEVIRDIKKIINQDIGPFMKYLGDAKGISFNELYQHDFKEFFDELGI